MRSTTLFVSGFVPNPDQTPSIWIPDGNPTTSLFDASNLLCLTRCGEDMKWRGQVLQSARRQLNPTQSDSHPTSNQLPV
jgi:hypothetical protein